MVTFRLDLWTRLSRMRSLMARMIEPYIQKQGLTVMQAVVLHTVGEGNSVTVGILCKTLDCAQGNMSNLCKKLEQDGFLTRKRSVVDERKVLLQLTEKGNAVMEEMNQCILSIDTFIASIPDKRRKTVLNGFDELEALLAEIADYTKKENTEYAGT